MSLIRSNPDTATNGIKKHRAKMVVETESFSDALRRKRVKLDVSTLAGLADGAEKGLGDYHDRLEQARLLSGRSGEATDEGDDFDRPSSGPAALEPVFAKGQSKRIWNELYRYVISVIWLS